MTDTALGIGLFLLCALLTGFCVGGLIVLWERKNAIPIEIWNERANRREDEAGDA